MIERYFIYFPERRLIGDPAAIGLEFEDLHFEAADGTRLHAWLVPGSGPHTLLWFHGNAGNVSDRLELLADLNRELGASIAILEYRGYGSSEGTPSERGLYLDAEALFDVVCARTGAPAHRIVLLGQSLGAAVAVALATRRQPAGVILESAFTSVAGMARHHYWWLPVWPLLKGRFDALEKIRELDGPVLIVHGDRDAIAPLWMGERLFAAAGEPKRLQVISGAGHNDVHIAGRDEYFAALREFMPGVSAAER